MNRRIEALALAGLMAVGCANPTDVSAQPTPIPTRNSPEFTLAPIPTPTSTPRPTEKPPAEQGWTRVRSTIYPYEISYPPGWTATANKAVNPPIDTYVSLNRVGNYQTNATVFSEPVPSWVRLSDYATNVQNQLTQNISIVRKEQKIVGPPVGLVNTKIAGQEAVVLNGLMPPFFFDPETVILIGIVIADGKAWRIGFVSAASTINEASEFNKMLDSFSFIPK